MKACFDTRDTFRIIGHVLELRHNYIDSKFRSLLVLSDEGHASVSVDLRLHSFCLIIMYHIDYLLHFLAMAAKFPALSMFSDPDNSI